MLEIGRPGNVWGEAYVGTVVDYELLKVITMNNDSKVLRVFARLINSLFSQIV